MNRLQSELHRLYFSRSPADAHDDDSSDVLIDDRDGVRAMVMALSRPPSWEVLSRVWHGVQTDMELPAPAIAVSGTDSIQLWFSLAEPVTVPQAQAFLESLRVRFLPEVKSGRVGLWPDLAATAQQQAQHAPMVPARQETTGNWSAFVAPDLAPVFDDTPWLDIPPSEEGQAALLRGLASMTSTAFEAVLERASGAPADRTGPASPLASAAHPETTPVDAAPEPDNTATGRADARRFLFRVMNDESVTLALRIDAAKALLRHSGKHR